MKECLLVSLILPVCNEEKTLEELHQRIKKVLKDIDFDYEMIFIDDGSTDNSLEILKEIQKNNSGIQIIQFRKNLGKSAALSVGFEKAMGDYIFTLDTDLQDNPEEIPNFIEKIKEGYDLVSGWKKDRHDPLIKVISSKFFNKTVAQITGLKIHDFNCGFKCYRNEVAKIINIRGEFHRLIPVIVHQLGFKVSEIPIKHSPRKHGKSKYGSFGLRRITNYLLDPISIVLLTKYAQKPVHFFGNIGLFSLLTGSIINIYLLILWIIGQRPIGNRPLLFLGILLIIIGVQLVSMGLLGEIIIQNKSDKDLKKYIKKIHK